MFLNPTVLRPKLTTGEKLAVAAGAAGVAFGACLAADLIEDIDFEFNIDYYPEYSSLDNAEFLEEIDYHLKKIKNSYYYELQCAKDYKNTKSLRLKELLQEDLCEYICRHNRHKHLEKIKLTILPQLRRFAYTAEKSMKKKYRNEYALSYTDRGTYKKMIRKIENMIKQFEFIYKNGKNCYHCINHLHFSR